MAILKTRAIYRNGVLKPDVKLDLPDGAAVEVEINPLRSSLSADPKDALLSDESTLQALYAEFGSEERHLVHEGLARYAEILRHEEDQA